ncbi:MAG: ATP-dependent DNA helicase, partial [Flavobacteriales bacterium]
VLEDLIQFVFQKPNNKLILVGDTAQLPPVGMTMSMALNAKDLQQNFWRNTDSFTLKEVKRQKEQSTVLWNATLLREFMTEEEDFSTTFPKLKTNQTDFFRQEDRFELEYALEQSMDKQGLDETVIICRSNKRANQYNQRIRQHFFGREEGIERGDLIMIVKNNYFWLEQTSDAGFLANGELATVEKIYRFIDLYGFRFVELELALVDYPNMESFRTIAFVDTLTVDGAGLTYADSQKLYAELQAEFAHLKSKSARYKNIKKNPYFNALQIKFAYAITCHKAQGGQWKNVFIEQPFWDLQHIDKEDYRWFYTALTRASEHVHLIGFNSTFFE